MGTIVLRRLKDRSSDYVCTRKKPAECYTQTDISRQQARRPWLVFTLNFILHALLNAMRPAVARLLRKNKHTPRRKVQPVLLAFTVCPTVHPLRHGLVTPAREHLSELHDAAEPKLTPMMPSP